MTPNTPGKPPLGLIPKEIWHAKKDRERLEAIFDAMTRYSERGVPIPPEWLNEFKEIWSRPIGTDE